MQSNFGTLWHDRSALSLEDLLEMATLGGAKALGMGDHIGSLEVGKQADFVVANVSDWDMQPVYDPMFTASRGLTGRDVETVVVEGKIVVDGGVVTSVDEAELRARLAERWPMIMNRFESITN
jgi:5-methylthioadenosine/S-adenosylhomocysteine deaminase